MCIVCIRDVRGGAFSSGAGRGEDDNLRGGPGRGKKARRSTDPKIRQDRVNLLLEDLYYSMVL